MTNKSSNRTNLEIINWGIDNNLKFGIYGLNLKKMIGYIIMHHLVFVIL